MQEGNCKIPRLFHYAWPFVDDHVPRHPGERREKGIKRGRVKEGGRDGERERGEGEGEGGRDRYRSIFMNGPVAVK